MSSRGIRIAGCIALLAGAALLVVARSPSERQEAIVATCEAVGEERYEDALAASEGLVGADPDGYIAAECRCWALLNLSQRDSCADLIDRLLVAAPESDWVPHPVLSALVVRYRGEHRRDAEAAQLARKATRRHPHEIRLLELEIQTRSAVEGSGDALGSMEARLDRGESSYPLRIALAAGYMRNHEARAARRVLGSKAPPAGHPLWLAWYEEHSRAIGSLGEIDELEILYRRWAADGGNPRDLAARFALRVSVSGMKARDVSEVEMLRDALVDHERLADPNLRWGLYRRLIGALTAAGQIDEALSVYDEAIRFVSFPSLTREEIERVALQRQSDPSVGFREIDPQDRQPQFAGTIGFQLQPSIREPGVLRVSPETSMPVDTDYERYSLAPGDLLQIERRSAVTPQRWVFRSLDGKNIASGAVWPVAGRNIEIEISGKSDAAVGAAPARKIVRSEKPGDGRRRVFAFVVDCADWRLTQYLRARGELPLFDQLIRSGYRAVLESKPAFTAAAMEALVWPTRGEHISFVGLIQRMGLELGGLASVGKNPVDFLSAIQPEARSLFEIVGAGDRVAANMLFSHGGIDAGKHAEVLGPDSRRGHLDLRRSHRPLTDVEIERFIRSDAGPRQRRRFETIAAEFDNAVEIVRAKDVDLLMIRIEPLDLLTHAFFGDLLKQGQDDGESALLDAYRYIDERLAQFYRELDSDDYLVVMSDHGIRTPMQHETDAIFVLVGDGVPAARAPGTPHLRGVPRILASLAGVETGWPDSGLATWSAPAPEPTSSDAVVAGR
jgi:hypothetical protein